MPTNKRPVSPLLVGTILIALAGFVNQDVLLEIFSNRKDLTQDAIPLFYGWLINGIRVASIIVGIWFILKRSRPQIVKLSSNLLLSLFSIGFVLCVLEIAFKAYLPNMPLGTQPFVDESFSIISQSSKTQPVAQEYLAIMGDSYAWGAGDWHLDSDPKSNQAFHSAHVIQNALQRDVITFGKPGASSITGLLVQPDLALRKLRYRYHIEDPQVILFYFYEGNDLTDNLRDLEFRSPNYFDYSGSQQLTRPTFRTYINEQILPAANGERTASYLIGTRFVKNVAVNLIKPKKVKPDDLSYDGPNSYNLVFQKDSVVQLPNRLQNPALNLNSDELKQSLQVLRYSMELMTERFKHSEIHLVYIPSVLSCYQLNGPVSVQGKGKEDAIYTREELEARSNYLVKEIQSYCQALNMGFINPREHLRQYSKNEILHGPKDWDHLNKRGYQLFGQYIVDQMEYKGPSSDLSVGGM